MQDVLYYVDESVEPCRQDHTVPSIYLVLVAYSVYAGQWAEPDPALAV